MVPPVALHVMEVLVLPVTVAENCTFAPGTTLAVEGDTDTVTVGAVGVPA
jgi:hypothetical protein